MKYIALLKGINVGGNHKIKMDALREMCGKIGLENVKTYIQSGNIVFDSSVESPAAIEDAIHQGIKDTFGFDIATLVLTEAYVKDTFANNPYLAENEAIDIKLLHVTFLKTEPAAELVEALNAMDFGTDEFKIIGTRAYLHFPNGYGRTKLTNAHFERKLKVEATTRNWRTVGKLSALIDS